MSLRGRAVDTLNVDRVVNHLLFKDPGPDPGLRPTIESIVDSRVRPILGWAIFPPATNFQDMNNPADHLAVASRFHATTVLRNRSLDRRELLVRQPKQIRHQFAPSFGSFESEPAESRQTEIGF